MFSYISPVNQSLIDAVKKGDTNEVDALLKRVGINPHFNVFGVNPNTQDKYGRTVLYLASQLGHLEIVELLLKAKAKIDTPDEEGRTPLMEAAWKGHLPIVKVLIQHGANIEAVRHSGWTPLITAAYYGKSAIVEYLVEAKAKLDVADTRGRTALMCAAKESDEESLRCLQILLQVKANANLTNEDNATALILAAQYNADAKKLELLLEQKVDVNVKDKNGNTALMYACLHGRIKNVKILVEWQADLALVNNAGYTPVMCAISHSEIVDFLVNAGANLHVISQNGKTALSIVMRDKFFDPEVVKILWEHHALDIDDNTPLMFAIKSNQPLLVEKLLHPDTVNIKNKQGLSALMMATELANCALIEKTLIAGADVNEVDIDGNTALMRCIAIFKDNAVVKLLIANKTDQSIANSHGYTALMLAAEKGLTEVVMQLLEANAENINAELTMDYKKGQTALYLAFNKSINNFEEYKKIIELLIDKGASIKGTKFNLTILEKDSKSNQLLRKKLNERFANAVYEGHESCVTELITHVDVNEPDKRGDTALISAATQGHLTIVNALLDAKATIDQKNSEGRTALMEACWKGHFNIVKRLTDANANVNATRDDRSTPLMKAASYGRKSILELLIEQKADVNAVNSYGNTALIEAAKEPYNPAQLACIEPLIAASANINVQNQEGLTPLIYAIKNSHPKEQTAISCLIELKADVNLGDKTKTMPLMYLTNNPGSAELANILLKAGADVNAKDTRGLTALYHAAGYKHADNLVDVLLANHAHPNPKGKSPLIAALKKEAANNALALLKKRYFIKV